MDLGANKPAIKKYVDKGLEKYHMAYILIVIYYQMTNTFFKEDIMKLFFSLQYRIIFSKFI